MKVLAVSTWYPSSGAEAEAPFNHEHVKAISQRHSVRVVHVRLHSSAPAATEIYDGVKVTRLSVNVWRPWSFAYTIFRLARELRTCDLVHTMAFSTVLAVAPAWLVSRRPWVHTEHWNGVTNPASIGRLWQTLSWSRCVLSLPHRVTGVTRQLADRLQEFARPGAATVVPCVVDNDRPLVPRPLGSTLRLVAVGGLLPRKRPIMALDTVKRLLDKGVDVHLDWVGGGPLEEEVRAYADRIGISGSVRFHGSVHPSTVFERIEEGDLFFLPSEQENFFTAAAEALSADRPVVAALVGGYDDYCTPENSVLVREATPDTLAEAILTARDNLAGEAPGFFAIPIRHRFSPASVAGLFDSAYDAAIGDYSGERLRSVKG